MAVDTNKPATSNWWKWFDPRHRDVGTWAFILNRITAIGLTVYLFIHLAVLFLLSQGPDAYGSFLELAKNPVIIFGELLVVIAGIYHGVNGIRIGLTTFTDTSPYQKMIFYILFVIAVLGSMIFAVRMFTA